MLALRTVTYCTENEETPTLFFTFFFGPPLWCAVALTSACRARPGWWWLATLVGLGYALGIVVFTQQVNLPLNQITESWTPATLPADWVVTRDEWNRANAWRAGWCSLLFALGLATLTWRAAGSQSTGTADLAMPGALR